MILQCPACDARFLINDALVPAVGRTVRCGKCKHEWHAMPSSVPMETEFSVPAQDEAPVFANFEEALATATATEAETMAASASTPTKLPVVQKSAFKAAPFIWATAAMAAIVWFVAPMAFYPEWKHGPLSGVYEAIGWSKSDGLGFADVQFSKDVDGTKTRYAVSGNITNNAKETRVIAEVRVTLKDARGTDIWSRIYQVGKALKAGESYPFEIANIETSFGERVKTLMLDVGNSFELGKR